MRKFLFYFFVFLLSLHAPFAQQKKADSVYELLQNTKKESEKLDLLIKLAHFSIPVNKGKATDYANNAVLLASDLNNLEKLIECKLVFGLIANGNSEFHKADSIFEQTLKSSQERGFTKGLTKSYLYGGNAKMNLGNQNQAIEYYSKALKIAKDQSYHNLHLSSILGIASYHTSQGNYSECLKYLQEAEKISISKNIGVFLHRIYFLRASTLIEKGDKVASLLYLRKAIDHAIDEGYHAGSAFYHQVIGTVYKDLDSLELAKKSLGTSLDLSIQYNRKQFIAKNYELYGEIYFKEKRFEQAIEYYKKTIKMSRKSDYVYGQFTSRCSLNRLYNITKQYDLALFNGNIAMNFAKRINNRTWISISAKGLAETYEGLGNYKKSLEYFKINKTINDSIFSLESEKQYSELELKYETNKKNQEILEQKSLIKSQEQANEIQELTISNRNWQLGIATFGVLILAIFLVVINKNLKKKKAAYAQISILNDSIVSQNIEIKNKNEKIERQHTKLKSLYDTKNEILKIVSHDLRTPVANFKMYLDLLRHYRNTGEDKEIQHLELELNDSALRLNNLTSRLLDWLYADQGEVITNKVNTNELLNMVKEINYSIAKIKNIEIVINSDMNHTIFSNENALVVIFNNIIGNAIKYSHKGGKIVCSSETFENHVTISIKDYGLGMSTVTLENLFNNKRRMPSKKGTLGEKGKGIGLLLVQELTQKLNSKLKIDSTENQGTEFKLIIPKRLNDNPN